MSKLSNDLIVNGIIQYTSGINLPAAVQPRLLYSGTITGTTGDPGTLVNIDNLVYRRDIVGGILIPSGYSRIQCSVCNANGTSSGLYFRTTPYIFNQGGGFYLAGVVLFDIRSGVNYRINYLVYATLDQV